MVETSREPHVRWIYGYPLIVRVTHWTHALCLLVLIMSGLQIFNAHPALYWGEDSDFDRPLLSIYAASMADGRTIGITRIRDQRFDTTGVLGRSQYRGRPVHRAFPAWATIPPAQDLATGRVWHLFFAWVFVINGALYVAHGAISRRFARDLLPRRQDLRGIGAALRDHLLFRLHRSGDDPRYNVIQRLTYLGVILVLAPVIVLTGLTMSPAVTAAAPWLLDLFGGRQSARTLHFVATGLFVLFVLVHVFMVIVSGVFNHMRAMTTGWYRVRR